MTRCLKLKRECLTVFIILCFPTTETLLKALRKLKSPKAEITMTYVCIPTTKNDDPNYRYKMPQMRLSQESRLNGVKTNITNLVDVARALRVPESAILKFFCVEVGANSEGTTIVKG